MSAHTHDDVARTVDALVAARHELNRSGVPPDVLAARVDDLTRRLSAAAMAVAVLLDDDRPERTREILDLLTVLLRPDPPAVTERIRRQGRGSGVSPSR